MNIEQKPSFSLSLNLPILVIVFIVLKLTGTISWSWWWIFSPLWIPFGLYVIVLVLLVLCAVFDR